MCYRTEAEELNAYSSATRTACSRDPNAMIAILTKQTSTALRTSFGLAVITTGFLLSGASYAAQPPPSAELQAAETAIATADQAHVADYASVELTTARRELNAAHDAVRNKNMTLARYLAEESTVGAKLASAKAQVIEAQMVNDNMIKSIATLKEEMKRNSGAK